MELIGLNLTYEDRVLLVLVFVAATTMPEVVLNTT
jgi:hypothetical protein